jgi:hypothetical protein
MSAGIVFAEVPIDGVGGVTPVRPGRTRARDEDKVKNAPGGKKKSPPLRKSPSRGRYVDEYARPPL